MGEERRGREGRGEGRGGGCRGGARERGGGEVWWGRGGG